MPLKLESATSADLPAIVTLMNTAFRGTGPEAGWNSEAAFLAGDRTSQALLAADIAAKPSAFMLLVRGDTTTSLQACVWLEPVSADIWHIGSLTVDPHLQNSGLGRSLLAATELYAAERGARAIRMKVVNVRDTLIAWYQRRGYRLTGETHPFPYTDTRFGLPLRSDLSFVALEKELA